MCQITKSLIRSSFVLLSLPLLSFAQAPTNLNVTAATSARVDLSWSGTASSYNVQRRALGGIFATIATVSTTTTADTQVDAYTTYQYQVLAASGSTTPSNTVITGPPPAGYSVAVPSPGAPGSDVSFDFAYDLTATLDGNGDPAMAYIFQDPNRDHDYADTELRFRSWNRAQYKWNSEVKVAAVGDVATTFHPTSSLAYDKSTKNFVIATEAEPGQIRLYMSTNGGTSWTLKTSYNNPDLEYVGPSVALNNGNIYLAFYESHAIRYYSGLLSGTPSTWATKLSNEDARQVAPSLALDNSGNPAIAYWAEDPNGDYNSILYFWRPSAAPTKVMDSQNRQSDQAAAKLLFYGANPRVIVYIQRDDADFGVGLHSATSNNGGTTWSTPVVIPPDGDSSTDYPFDFAIDSQGHGALGFGQNSGSGDTKCGNPKLSRTNDFATWTTCSTGSLDATGAFTVYPGGIATLLGGNDRLYMIWRETYDNPTGTGLIMFREPPTGASNTPTLDPGSAVNGATYLTGMVPGSWAQVKGSNLSDVTRIWQDADFNGLGSNLPTNLSGVQVKVNNLPAAVYFVSPGQVSFQVPGGVSGTASVQVIRNGATSNTVTGDAVANAPGLFGYSLGGKTYPAAVYAGTFTVVGDPAVGGEAVRKAAPGDHIQLYATGIQSSPAGVIPGAGSNIPGVTATIGTTPATVEFAGLVAVGEFQVNILVPNLANGEYPVTIKFNGQTSQANIIVPVGK